jgi:hypothetical protein
MSIWDKLDRFTAEAASNLAHPNNPSEAKALLTMMQKAYEKALRQVFFKHIEIHHPQAMVSHESKAAYRSLDDPIPPDCLLSYSLTLQAELLFQPNSGIATCTFFHNWCADETGNDGAFSSNFHAQEFTRDELHRWLTCHELDSDYSFERIEPPASVVLASQELDISVLATPTQLLKAFGSWGLMKGWLDCPRKHGWLLAARKRIGVGGNRSKPPLYCPYEVMVGLCTKTKPRKGAERMSLERGWKKLRHFFPDTHLKFEHLRIFDDQSF